MFSAKKIFNYYWQEAKKYKAFFFVALFTYGGGVLLGTIIVPLYYREIIDTIASSNNSSEIAGELLNIVKIIAIMMVSASICYRLGDYALIRFHSKTMRDLINFSFKNLEMHSYSFFADHFVGSITAKVRRFISAFENILDTSIFRFLFSFLQICGVLIVFFIIEPVFGWMFLIWITIYTTFVVLRIPKQIKYNLEESKIDSLITARLADVLGNIMAVKMFSAEEREKDIFEEKTKKQEKRRMVAWGYAVNTIGVQSILLVILEIVAIWMAIKLWIEGQITAGTIVLIQSYIIVLVGGLIHIGQRIIKVFQELTRAQEMIDIFEQEWSVEDPNNPQELKIRSGKIEFKNVFFKYEKESNHILKNFSLVVNPGERVGLVGPSGAGKSTITKILLRFIDINKGTIEIDGQDIKNVTQKDLRESIAYVPQDALMFHRTIRENITYGRPNATEEEIIEATKRAKIHDFISQLPKGYETFVGERGVKLSGGEKQRVAIARAILKNAPLLILDEATSSLDTISEIAIKEALRELMKEKTTIVIAHRLSTVKEFDRILVLRHGEIVEQGSHKDLLNIENGLYASLWEHQAGE